MTGHPHNLMDLANIAGKTFRETKARAANARRQGCTALPGFARPLLLFGIGFSLLTAMAFIPSLSPTVLTQPQPLSAQGIQKMTRCCWNTRPG